MSSTDQVRQSKVKKYQDFAQECRLKAAAADEAQDKERWARLAELWDKLARDTEWGSVYLSPERELDLAS
jgi:hypothetical protein